MIKFFPQIKKCHSDPDAMPSGVRISSKTVSNQRIVTSLITFTPCLAARLAHNDRLIL